MKAEVPRRGFGNFLRHELGTLWSFVRGSGAALYRNPGPRSLLTAAEFQEELAILGLSGRSFEPRDYADALGAYLDISIAIQVIPDDWYPELSRRLAISGRLGELRYSEHLNVAAILVPGSLPPLVLTLTIYHELGHLAAGDLLIEPTEEDRESNHRGLEDGRFATSFPKKGKRLARAFPFTTEPPREREANLRASYALFAGCLGEDSPHADAMYSVL